MIRSQRDEWQLLQQAVARVVKQVAHLHYTLDRLDPACPLDDPAIVERYEALTARFSRLQDTLVGPFRSIALLELEEQKAERIPDLLNLMEKRGIVPAAGDWPAMRRLRNAITHEYWDHPDELRELFTLVAHYSRILMATVTNLSHYVARLEQQSRLE